MGRPSVQLAARAGSHPILLLSEFYTVFGFDFRSAFVFGRFRFCRDSTPSTVHCMHTFDFTYDMNFSFSFSYF